MYTKFAKMLMAFVAIASAVLICAAATGVL
jgi:hypothetical protein